MEADRLAVAAFVVALGGLAASIYGVVTEDGWWLWVAWPLAATFYGVAMYFAGPSGRAVNRWRSRR